MSLRIHTLAPMLAAGALLVVQPSEALARVKPPLPAPTTVNCTAGQSINAAIANGFTVITVRGQCNEEVEIAIDNIWLLSHPSVPGSIRSSVEAPLTILGAEGIYIEDIEIEALGGVTVAVFIEHSSVHLQDVNVIGGSNVGIEARRNASVTYNGGTISGSGVGAIASLSSNLSLNSATVTGIDFVGAGAQSGAYLTIGGSTFSGAGSMQGSVGVTVSTNAGVEIFPGSAVSGFGRAGVVAIGGGVRIAGATVSGNGVDPGVATYPGDGGVIVAAGSNVRVEQSAMITGNTGWGLALVDGSGGDCGVVTISGNSVANVHKSAGSEASTC